ncbi:N-acetylglucosaminyl-phosphatidylinositol de-N-acetylase [Hondaea fermentalgiana]|uniref:N-acetylglucosaminylphosphatidylinositol deacetylase n=1 Tax=Hondaea fermentalgiana TaxID=2315210 RepID=A0A2R5GP27_9STRA|nr:N-acetylglucosaminyl-phosphatidylinositol de-N-acetylase [Hondaea fermentalgiana]|eukprot:GBG31528.1 N-acetylglucosaminyl-phosphatidylinositol de-N-acetylase [Hondaea fermentalgiana]
MAGLVFMNALKRLRTIRNSSRNEELLLVTAHPDDESMFFLPTIRAFDPRHVTVLSLSNGNYDGIGDKRQEELRVCCCEQLGLPAENVIVANHPDLQDGPDQAWPAAVVADTADKELSALQKRTGMKKVLVVTFDAQGVSGHVNHRAVSQGLRVLAARRRADPWSSFYELESVGLSAKYGGPATAWKWYAGAPASALQFFNANLGLNYAAMSAHASQFVWYRRLFVLFSVYTFANRLAPVYPERCLLKKED